MQKTKRMGAIVYFPFILLGIGLLTSACQKNLQKADSLFDAKAAKEWYYGVFKKSAEFKASSEWGKKLPGWEFGVYRRVGGMEIVEFPLFRKKYKVSLDVSSTKNEAELRQIARGSLSRIVFIRKPDGSMFVRELTYVPSLSYLQKKNFDISDVHLGLDNSGGFSGRVLLGKWDGTPLSVQVFTGGKLSKIRKVRIENAVRSEISADASQNCEPYEVCEYYRDCVEYYHNDVWVETVCTEWQPTGFCWTEDDCEEPVDECDYSLAESCECQLYQLGCEDDEGGGEDPIDCSSIEAEAERYFTAEWEKHTNNVVIEEATKESLVPSAHTGDVFYDQLNPWLIARNLIGIWRVEAYAHVICSFDNHSINDNVSLSIQHRGSDYIGWNNIIISTWTENTVISPRIVDNHTRKPWGYYSVSGTITHKMKAQVEYEKNGCKITKELGWEKSEPLMNQYIHRVI